MSLIVQCHPRPPRIGDLNLSINIRAVLIKFPTPHGVGNVRGDQESAQTYYASSVKLKTKITYEAYCLDAYGGATSNYATVVDP